MGPPGVVKRRWPVFWLPWWDTILSPCLLFSGVKDIRQAVLQAEANRARNQKTILFIDEIHRFNKVSRMHCLPYIESGLFCIY